MQNTSELRKTLLSLGLSHILDCLGYSPLMVNLRRKLYRNMDCISTGSQLNTIPRLLGSKGEGVSRMYESDQDYIRICNEVVCLETSVLKYTERFPELKSVFKMAPCLNHPGHFKLLLIREGLPSDVIENLRICLNPSDSGHWLSSKEFLRLAKYLDLQADTTAGPAVCTFCRLDNINQDNTLTLPCICPSILYDWIQRDRQCNWPPKEVIQQISQMSGNLVATGIKGCHDEEIEWRLCFNEIEVLLVENWNETLTKLYIILKMIKKDILKLQNEITSYMIKNILFWLSERYPESDFRPDSLFSWVFKALRLLKRAVKNFHLPYYMIPERNLIAEKLPKYRTKFVIIQVNNAIKLGPQLLWGCRKTKRAMLMSVPELRLYQEKIDEMELLRLLELQDRTLKSENGDILGFDERLLSYFANLAALQNRFKELLSSPWPPVIQEQLGECSDMQAVHQLLLR